jgi:hypothetical protein
VLHILIVAAPKQAKHPPKHPKTMDKDRLKASKTLSSGEMTNCITQHGEWRYDKLQLAIPNNCIIQVPIKLIYDAGGLACVTTAEYSNVVFVHFHDVKFYQNGRYSGFRLKQLKQ